MSSNTTLPLHMYIRPLTIEDAKQVSDLETEGFPANERASLENIKYRLNTSPELCSGLFIRNFESDSITIKDETLIGHILGTKINTPTKFITLESMKVGNHIESSDTIAIHSVVIAQKYQKKNLATLLLTDYIQKLSNQEIGNKIVIIAHEHLVPFYERVGFQLHGENTDVVNDSTFASSKWMDMARELIKEEYDS
ncbi:hypothetical protein TBLA_0F03600 [Henningerozyma blattae CBS 6284]|uniref:N-acetyltransferase domain-containing protein n=1 Tax=Henningerozyma blattae (strain ATCC 34711 / CBS 6284 / DSM 70876 / NBRC 10599 / NRRL Y-10934 / UCD 77-7) TaxID=1071380 RepID=I2H695_HENB6|nr:hypothetical protein TBLA_0F03600 [Tetrapisispora blattae CBS 6284]CCH61897.1 hypothetical protein TBLA_0F03600 [Tetrapisispora blattae CBS 6284]